MQSLCVTSKNILPAVIYKYWLENEALDNVLALGWSCWLVGHSQVTPCTHCAVTERAGPSRPGDCITASEITRLPCCFFFFFLSDSKF